ncbi:type I restriction enzyme subunit R domain-containing protein [Nitrosococcus wardiae]|uniref:Type I restriction endonuclease subunit R n=1 Tax=Nitrosococcus wardiae TaxID=1814290 RepID=A0A4P7C1D3_9GAMM|nr:type I restriction endonuclease subunit R [Nitrosococcus wardiae]QBQ56181.1 type I restriction endonuclease subunit R [Nitrosococcus wardiae]
MTGFDAPSAIYLYIDKKMQDHGLFQAICRVNRLDGEDKEYGYIIDYKDLFKSLEGAIGDYTGGALEGYDRADVAGLLENRLEKGRERLEEAREAVKALCEPVAPPKDTGAYLHYFCAADTLDQAALKDNEPKRIALYKAVSALVRAFANLANEMPDAGYRNTEIEAIRQEVDHYEKVRHEVKLGSGDYVDMKVFEPAMRHLLDTYLQAEDSEVISAFDDLGLVELIVEQGLGALDKLPKGIRDNPEAMAETIEHNVRKLIIDEQPVNPKYYEKMSQLLDALIQERKAQALAYQEYLKKLVELSGKVKKPTATTAYPTSLNTPARRALYDNLDYNEALAVKIDTAVRYTKKDDWRGNRFKEREVENAIREELGEYAMKTPEIFELVKNQREY